MSALGRHIFFSFVSYLTTANVAASVVQVANNDVIGEDNSGEADDVIGDVTADDETDDDDDEDMEIQDDSLGGDSKELTERKTKRRRKQKEKAPQPVTDVLITPRNDVTDDVSLTY